MIPPCPGCGRNLKRLRPSQILILNYLSSGMSNRELTSHLGITENALKARLGILFDLFGLRGSECEPRVKLAVWWSSELFRIGLKELGML